ncbi:MAG: hypothetical protein L0Y54_05630 [Sporichthyaceae bacterium]|nr:hypothetical protein [Sporichthyaceae bacterium]
MNRTALILIALALGLGTTACSESEQQAFTETILRNAAAVGGVDEFKEVGHELAGPLTCTAAAAGAENFTVNCTGTTKTGNQPVTMTGQVDQGAKTSSDAENGVLLEGVEFVGMVGAQEVFRKTCIGSGC